MVKARDRSRRRRGGDILAFVCPHISVTCRSFSVGNDLTRDLHCDKMENDARMREGKPYRNQSHWSYVTVNRL